ncbi:MAG: hypothetical protein AB8B66_02310 [Rickettsiaceae bacterium]
MTQLVGQPNIQNNAIDAVDKLYKYSEILAGSTIIPAHYRGQTSDVFVAVQTAYRMNQDPMMVMQGTYIIKGKLSMYTSFAISLANSSGVLQGGIRYKIEGSGDDLKVTAFSNLKANDAEISYTISMKEAKAEGWTSNAKYKSLPELMLRYRAATLLIRTHIPEVLNGMHTVEELKDVELNNKPIKLKEVSSEEKAENTINSYLDEKDSEEIKTITAKSNFAHKVNNLEILINQSDLSKDIVNSWLKKAQAETIADLSEEQIQSCIDFMHKNAHVKTSVAG